MLQLAEIVGVLAIDQQLLCIFLEFLCIHDIVKKTTKIQIIELCISNKHASQDLQKCFLEGFAKLLVNKTSSEHKRRY